MIQDVTPVEPLVDANVVEILERALAQAKAGEIRAAAVAVVFNDYAMQAHICWGASASSALLGSVDRLRYKMNQDLDA